MCFLFHPILILWIMGLLYKFPLQIFLNILQQVLKVMNRALKTVVLDLYHFPLRFSVKCNSEQQTRSLIITLIIFIQVYTCYNSELKALKQEEISLKPRLATDTFAYDCLLRSNVVLMHWVTADPVVGHMSVSMPVWQWSFLLDFFTPQKFANWKWISKNFRSVMMYILVTLGHVLWTLFIILLLV